MTGLVSAYRDTLPTHLHKLLDHYHFEDFAFKVVGVGSVGTRCLSSCCYWPTAMIRCCCRLKEARAIGAGAVCRCESSSPITDSAWW